MGKLTGLLALLLLPLAVQAETRPSGIELENFDRSVRPQDDFYRFVNGAWLKATEIPPDRSNYGAFTVLSDRAEQQLRTIILDAAASDAAPGSEQQKVGDLYASFMDVAEVNKRGLAPLEADLRLIERLHSHAQIPSLAAQLSPIGVEGFLGGYVYRDAKAPDRNILYLEQAGLGLPDRDYYLSEERKFRDLRAGYRDYVRDMLQLAGSLDAAATADRILALETRLAQAQWTKVANRDAQKTYNPYPIDELNLLSPGLDLARFLRESGVTGSDTVIVRQPSYLAALPAIIEDTPVATWREYFRLRLLGHYAPYLHDAAVSRHFDFYGRQLNGVAQIRPRWKRGVESVEDALGEVLGRIYVERHFPPAHKARMEGLVANLITAYRHSIQNLEWMSPATQQQALEKLSKFRPKIGYPDKWKDYSGLTINPKDLHGNIRRARYDAHQRALAKLGRPVDDSEWFMTPQTVNAYYSPVGNEIVFPAAILQPPFFNAEAEPAVNYGAIGAVIGHEIGHGFDDQGSRFDGDGRLRNWWTEADRERFESRTRQLIEQYAGYEPLPGHHVNGELTVGENIGDLGGLSIAAKAYRIALDGAPAPVIDGFTGAQRLLIGWAQIWKRQWRDEALLNRIKTDPHAPSEYRCNGVVANVPLFYDAFDVKPGDELYRPPEKRVSIW